MDKQRYGIAALQGGHFEFLMWSYTSLQPSWLALIPSVYYLRCAIAASSFYFSLQQHLVPVGVKTHLSLQGLMHFIAL